MIQRSEAFCDGQIIGIESIYTVIDGKQINIPDRLKSLRAKSRNNLLFCPCGCGANLILIAGDKNLREQHFRIKGSEENQNCTYRVEGRTSIWSKIVLKCWLEDKLKTSDIESRVQICDINDTNRRYEFSFLSRSCSLAVSYCRGRENLSDEKLGLLDKCKKDNKIIYIVDYSNGGSEGQYPEGLMKVQERQGYCLLLRVESKNYYDASLEAVFFAKRADGQWEQVRFASGSLQDYEIDSSGILCIKSQGALDSLCARVKDSYELAQQYEKERLRKEKEEREKREARARTEEVKRQEKIQKMYEEAKKERERQESEAKRIQEENERRRQEKEKQEAEEKGIRWEQFWNGIEEAVLSPDHIVKDPDGIRWVKCLTCGKIAKASEFTVLSGGRTINFGKCQECMKKPIHKESESEKTPKMSNKLGKCPLCGGNLVERNGRYGKFLGCSNYPRCRFID